MPDEKKPTLGEYRIPTPRSMDAMPPQPETKQLPAMTDRALLEDLGRVVRAGFKEMRADIHLVSSDLQVVKDRVVILEKAKIESDERLSRASGGTRQLSANDSKQDATIANIVTEVAAVKSMLAANTSTTDEIKKAVSGFFQKHPAVGTAFVNLVLAALAYATWRLQR